MIIKGFKMKLYPGMEAEYEKRHNQLWPEMKDMIHEHGGRNYTIFLDKETLTLFGYIEIEDEKKWAEGADTAINRKWWDFMADIMDTNPDNSPVCIDLHEVFHLD
jgi:L-rhamnose mutarotase